MKTAKIQQNSELSKTIFQYIQKSAENRFRPSSQVAPGLPNSKKIPKIHQHS